MSRPSHGGKKLVSTSPSGNAKIGSLSSSPTNHDKLLETSTGSLDSDRPALGAIRKEPVAREADVPPLKESETEPEVVRPSIEKEEPDQKEEEDEEPARTHIEAPTEEEIEEMKAHIGTATQEDILNATEVASPQRQKAISAQNIGKAFFASLSIKRSTELAKYPINDPLIVSANTGSSIDVQMILEEMGASAFRNVTTRDTYGRTALHVAAMGDSPEVVQHLMETYRRNAYRKFSDELYKLEQERDKSEKEITRALKAAGNKYAGSTLRQVPQLKSVEDWFNNEVIRLQRSIEIRVEVNRAKILATKDKFGRTPIHYAASSGAPASVMKALTTSGAANLHGHGIARRKSSSASISRSSLSPTRRSTNGSGGSTLAGLDQDKRWFDPDAVYETSSGTEIASATSNAGSNIDSGALNALRSSRDASKTGGVPTMTTSLRNVAWELGGQDGVSGSTTMEEDKQQMFEIMIPWVLRNMMRRVTELGSREATSGITELEGMIDKHCCQPAACLIVPELKTLLGKLGIQVTREVLRELCKRYAAESGSISDKWGVVEDAYRQEAERVRRQAEEKDRLKRIYGSDFKHGMVDAKGDWAEGKSADNGGANGLRSSKDGAPDASRGDAKGQDARAESKDGGAESSAAGGGEDTKTSSAGAKGDDGDETAAAAATADEFMSDTRAETERMLELERLDADYGLDLHLLLTDIKNGRAFQPLFISKDAEAQRNAAIASNENFSSSLNKGIDTFCAGDDKRIKEMNDLLLESKDGGERGAAAGAMSSTQAKVDMDHFGGTQSFSHTNTHCAFELPACVSARSISRARRSIIDVADSFGRTPLMLASALGFTDVVNLLVEEGADVSVSTPEGHSALSLAQGRAIHNLLEKALLRWLNDRSSLNALGNEKRLIDTKSSGDHRGDGGASQEMQSTITAMTNVGTTDKTLLGTSNRSHEARSQVMMGMKGHLKQLGLNKWSYSRFPLSWAVNNGLTKVVEALLAEKEPVNQVDAVGRTALHECATLVREGKSVTLLEESVKIAELLFSAGADPNKGSVSLRTPLHELFCRGQDEASASFTRLSGGKASYYVTEGSTDPILKAKFKRVMVRVMLQWGADALAQDRHGLGAVHYCAKEDSAGCMVEMLRAGVDGAALTGHSKATPLHIACKAGAARVGNLVCRWDADSGPGKSLLDFRDGTGKIPAQLLPNSTSPRCLDTLWVLAYQGNLQRVSEVLNSMKRAGGDARWEDIAEQTYNPDDEEAPEESKEGGGGEKDDGGGKSKADIDREDLQLTQRDYKEEEQRYDEGHKKPFNPMDWAPRELWLLDGVDAKSRRLRWSAIHACIIGWAELQAKGVPSTGPAMPGRGKPRPKYNICARQALMRESTPKEVRHISAAQLHKETLMFLLSSNAFCDAVDTYCRTPLMLAAATNLTEAVEILLSAGADTNARDLDGNTALHLAYAFGAASSVVAMEASGADQDAKNHAGKPPLELAGKSKSVHLL